MKFFLHEEWRRSLLAWWSAWTCWRHCVHTYMHKTRRWKKGCSTLSLASIAHANIQNPLQPVWSASVTGMHVWLCMLALWIQQQPCHLTPWSTGHWCCCRLPWLTAAGLHQATALPSWWQSPMPTILTPVTRLYIQWLSCQTKVCGHHIEPQIVVNRLTFFGCYLFIFMCFFGFVILSLLQHYFMIQIMTQVWLIWEATVPFVVTAYFNAQRSDISDTHVNLPETTCPVELRLTAWQQLNRASMCANWLRSWFDTWPSCDKTSFVDNQKTHSAWQKQSARPRHSSLIEAKPRKREHGISVRQIQQHCWQH